MLFDPVRIADTRAWLLKANDDLRGAQIDLDADPPLLGDVFFHCQQAVEKSLKAFLTWHDTPFRKTHDLVVLGGLCVKIDANLEPLLRSVAPLTEYAWKFRYPGDVSIPDLSEAKLSLALARQVLDAVLARLPSETYP